MTEAVARNVPHEGYMDSQVAVNAGALQANVDTERHARPCWVTCLTVETHLRGLVRRAVQLVCDDTYLVLLLGLQHLEDGVRLSFRGVSHGSQYTRRYVGWTKSTSTPVGVDVWDGGRWSG